jgi:23S rRNA pseudouridine1911/1915/1917 synthase
MLHAFRLGFRHPRTGRPVEFEAPLPEDFLDAARALRPLPT